MEITESTIYWLTRLDALNGVIIAIALCLTAFAIIYGNCRYEEWPEKKPLTIFASVLAVLFWIALGFIPTTKEMVAIKLVPAIANSESARAIGDKLPKMVDFLLKIDESEKKLNQYLDYREQSGIIATRKGKDNGATSASCLGFFSRSRLPREY